MREVWLCFALLTVGFAGCIGDDLEPAQAGPVASSDEPNPWQRGLDDTYPTPDVAPTRSSEERRANVAPPGDPEFAAFDAQMEQWMETHDIPTGTLAIMKDGQLRYENGYGYTDREGTQPANASTMMRIASISKPMTARVLAMMVEEGHLDWEEPVFCVAPDPKPECILPLEPHPNRPVVDRRLENITVGHLRNYTAGFATDGPCNDPLWSEGVIEAADTLGVPSPPPAWRVAQWLMGAKLAHAPGETYEYCNAGYVTLGVVAEAVTGASLEALFEAYLFRPLDVRGEIEPGRTLPEHRNPREPFYACDGGQTTSVYDPNETVCWADGGFSVETELANGGLVSTASAVVAVMETLPIDWPSIALGPVEYQPGWDLHYGASGSMPGTRAYTGIVDGTETGKLQYAFIFNTRTPWEGCSSPAGAILYETGTPGCNVRDLRDAMLPLLRAWSTADRQIPDGAIGGVAS